MYDKKDAVLLYAFILLKNQESYISGKTHAKPVFYMHLYVISARSYFALATLNLFFFLARKIIYKTCLSTYPTFF